MTWWNQRTHREQVLLGLGAGLVVLSILYLSIVRPLQGFNSEAESVYRSSLQLNRDVNALALRIGTLSAQDKEQGVRDSRPVRVIASEAARQKGLGLTRIQPTDDGLVSFWFDGVASPDLFSWMVTLNSDYGIGIDKVDIQKSFEGQSVNAQVVLQGER